MQDGLQLDEQQKLLVAKNIRGDFERFWEFAVENGDSDFLKYVYRLIFRVYEMHIAGKYMTKMQCCHYIPLKHAATCKKYLDIAEKQEFFRFESSNTDARKIIVKPGPALLHFVADVIQSRVDEMAEIVSDPHKELPKN